MSNPRYSAFGCCCFSSGHCTRNRSAKWYRILPVSDRCSTRAKLSTKMIFTNLSPSICEGKCFLSRWQADQSVDQTFGLHVCSRYKDPHPWEVGHHADGNTCPRSVAQDLSKGGNEGGGGHPVRTKEQKMIHNNKKTKNRVVITTSGMSVSTMKMQDRSDRSVVKKEDTQGWATSLLRGILLILNY